MSLRVLLIHDPLLLRSLLLLTPGLSCLLALSVSLLQEVLLHAGPVSVGFLFALNAQRGPIRFCFKSLDSSASQRGHTGRMYTHLSVERELLDFIDAVDHHVHERKQSVHVFGRGVAHSRHYRHTQNP